MFFEIFTKRESSSHLENEASRFSKTQLAWNDVENVRHKFSSFYVSWLYFDFVLCSCDYRFWCFAISYIFTLVLVSWSNWFSPLFLWNLWSVRLPLITYSFHPFTHLNAFPLWFPPHFPPVSCVSSFLLTFSFRFLVQRKSMPGHAIQMPSATTFHVMIHSSQPSSLDSSTAADCAVFFFAHKQKGGMRSGIA